MPANRSRPWLRRVLVGAGVLAALAGGALAWIAFTFDPNGWKPTLVEQVAQRYDRTLTLDGDIRLTLFPALGAEVGGVSLSERAGSTEFAGADRLRASLALLPLLRGRVVVRELAIIRPRATLVTRKDGSRNIDDLLAGAAGGKADGADGAGSAPADAAAPAIGLDIGRIVVEKGGFTSRDERTGRVLSMSALELSTGRIGGDTTEPFNLSVVLQASDPGVDLRAEARGRLLLDLRAGRFGVGALVASLSGTAGGTPIDVKMEAARLSSAPGAIEVEKLKLGLRQGDARRSLSIELSLPALQAVDRVFKGAGLALVADHRAGADTLNLRGALVLQGRLAEGGRGLVRVEAPEIKADIEGRLGGHTVQGSARAQAASDLQAGRHEASRYSLKATLFGLDAPARDVTLAIDGTASIDAAAGVVAGTAEGRLNETSLRARVSRRGADALWTFDVEADQFDLDRYRPAPVAAAPAAAPPATAAPGAAGSAAAADPLDFGFLEGLSLAGALRVGALRVAGVRAATVRIDLAASDGRLDASPIVATLYSGRLQGGLSLVQGKVPRVLVRQQLSGVQVGPLLADAAKVELVEGRGDIRVDLSTEGRSVDALRRALSGSASVSLADGALRGVDIAGVLREARGRIAQLRGREARAAAASERTGFTELKASFTLRDGIARSSDLSMKSPLLRAGGEGQIDIGAGRIDYLLRPTIVGTLGGQGGRDASELRGITVPVRITGPLARPEYDFDLQAMVAGAARQEIQRRATDLLQERLGAGKGEPGAAGRASPPADLLKGLLGR
ncbi:MAG: AsmA family protein [bacterium]